MTNIARLPPLGIKADRPTAAEIAAGKAHMAQLPCVICGRPVEGIAT